ncbi:DedA family protein [Rhodospirillales bacterium]|nr:DedA family protein [Rhodospirillales bacterium]
MLRRIYGWTFELAAHKHALLALAFVSFLESSIFPIPPDIMLIPMVLATRDRAWMIASVCTAASVLGGMAGYGIGALLFDQIGEPVLNFYQYNSKFEEFQQAYTNWGAWAVFIAGVTPFPYKVITILSGATHLDFGIFSFSSLIARGLRFFVVTALLWYLGESIREFIERRLGFLFLIFVVLLLCGYLFVKFML